MALKSDAAREAINGTPRRPRAFAVLIIAAASLLSASGPAFASYRGTLTQGSVVFTGATGNDAQDNANFFWDAANHRLGVGSATPANALDVNGTVAATTFSGSGASLTSLAAGNISSGTLAVARGGTGLATITANGIMYGQGASAAIATAAGSQYNVFVAGASGVPGFGQLNLSQSAAVAGTLLAAQEPAHTGDVTNSAGSLATTVAAIQGKTVSGTTGTGNVVFSASPTLSGTLYVSGSASSYGSITIDGSKNGWSGINFKSAGSNQATLMVSGDTIGFFNNADSGWDWYWSGGTLVVGSIPIANISASGTRSSSTYLRGDSTWAAAGGGVSASEMKTASCGPSWCVATATCDAGYFISSCNGGCQSVTQNSGTNNGTQCCGTTVTIMCVK